jgi:hypothetical protein
MGSVSSAISKAALEAGAQIVTNAEVSFLFLCHNVSSLICSTSLWHSKFSGLIRTGSKQLTVFL